MKHGASHARREQVKVYARPCFVGVGYRYSVLGTLYSVRCRSSGGKVGGEVGGRLGEGWGKVR